MHYQLNFVYRAGRFVEKDLKNHPRVRWNEGGGDPVLVVHENGAYIPYPLSSKTRNEVLAILSNHNI